MNKAYDAVVVGAGLYGATYARLAAEKGLKVLVLEKRSHVAGNCYDYTRENILIHKYGAHIFHTNDKEVWQFVNRFCSFAPYKHKVKAISEGKKYSLPFSLKTFMEVYHCGPIKAKRLIPKKNDTSFKNLEERGIATLTKPVFDKLVKGYTEKQWRKLCSELPEDILGRLPIRDNYNTNYFNDAYQGLPKAGYTMLVTRMLRHPNIQLMLNVDYLENKKRWNAYGKHIVYTGLIDEYFNYKYGELEYRSLIFDTERLEIKQSQELPVINYTEKEVPFTRIIEHKNFLHQKSDITFITKEYPVTYDKHVNLPYYPVNTEANNVLFDKYNKLASKLKIVSFGGRLGCYKYFDMDDTIAKAMKDFKAYYEQTN